MAEQKNASDNLSLESVVQAFDKVKGEFETDGAYLSIITKDRYDDVIEIMGNHFTPDEPLCRAFGVVWNPAFEKIVRELLSENISVMMVHKETNDVMGVRISGVMKKSDVADLNLVDNEPLRSLFQFITHKENEIDFFQRFNLDEAIHFFSLGVNKKYRRRGLGTKLMGACLALGRELGFKAVKGEGTSNFSQRIYERYGFEVLARLPYDSYIYKGEPIRTGTGEHTVTNVYWISL